MRYLYAGVRSWRIHYLTHDGVVRRAYVLLPAWYGPNDHPPIPLVISPHGRGVDPRSNIRLWGGLPALGTFGVVNPEGQGRRLELFSWGYPGQIEDLARMPQILERALPWLRLDRRKIYAVGGSMGGQEVLLLAARHPGLLAGAAAFDAATDLAARYYAFARLRCGSLCLRRWDAPLGERLQALARFEMGGSPRQNPFAYAIRSPLTFARALGRSEVPLQLWWSIADQVVVDQRDESGRLYREITRWSPRAPVVEFVGRWQHSQEMRYSSKLRIALARFGLLRPADVARACGMVPGPNDTLVARSRQDRVPLACAMFRPKPAPTPRPKPRPKPAAPPAPPPQPYVPVPTEPQPYEPTPGTALSSAGSTTG